MVVITFTLEVQIAIRSGTHAATDTMSKDHDVACLVVSEHYSRMSDGRSDRKKCYLIGFGTIKKRC